MAMEEKNKKIKKIKKIKKKKDTKSSPDISFKPSSAVKGLKFGGQVIVKSFTIRRARTLELLKLLSLPSSSSPSPPLLSMAAYLPTNFTILAHQAWHTLTLGLGTRKSKVIVFVFETEAMKTAVTAAEGGLWPSEIPLGEVNKKMIRKLKSWEMARFKFRKGCITFYVYAVRNAGGEGFAAAEDLKVILQAVVALKDFMDHTAMLVMPHQKAINYASCPPFAMAH
ncbi:Uncharacterized protein Rs2_18661 [Raphanus sativus]|uniref:Uncharacterized protein LOC108851664 n=1 Tax=Raphanus sativus TaxID=3726 RepID=A0A6J0N7U3_RAPSA|nr:uncharacterized protein LOC108851664 [Raphanus sativus]XP_056863777.1 uncharacterized protein LOC130511019 [Raphanus sativus]KAJ4866111.1 Uncharacterized protein Rs2_52372 [Raphanus sativus]KAJ4904710.1 Uncharacterized protein Rs2_18661 [Raphanus sativus]